MDCDEARKFLGAYLDDELEVKDALDLRGHLGECEGCRSRYEADRALKETLRERLGGVRVPDLLRARILRELRREERRVLRPRLALAWGAVAAALLLVVGGGLLYRKATAFPEGLIGAAVRNHGVAFGGKRYEEMRTADARALAQWFAVRGVHVKIPSFRILPGQLLGGRISRVNGQLTPYVLYQVGEAKASLVIVPAAGVQLPWFATWRKGEFSYHRTQRERYKVVLWKDSGRLYCLVVESMEDPGIRRLLRLGSV
ncbi:MAG: anti-sigma factor family protein [Nitrospinota bacterium]